MSQYRLLKTQQYYMSRLFFVIAKVYNMKKGSA